MNQRGFVAIGTAQIGADNRQWIEVMPTADKTRNGPYYFTITADDLEVFAESIRANAGKGVIDYDHGGHPTVDGSTKASGWFTGEARVVDTDDRGPILEAEVEWTPTAAQQIRDGEYRFVSPEFSFQERDKKTGLGTKAKDLVAATLTNRPFFGQLSALASDTVVWTKEMGFSKIQDRLSQALNPDANNWEYWVLDIELAPDLASGKGLVEDCGPEGTSYVVPFTLDAARAVTPAPESDWVAAESEWVATSRAASAHLDLHKPTGGASAPNKGDHVSEEELKALAADLGLSEDATAEEITSAVKAAKEKADSADTLAAEVETLKAAKVSVGDDDSVTLDKATFEELKAKADDGATALATQVTARQHNAVDEAIKAGKIMPSRRDHFVALMSKDEDGTVEYLNTLEADAIPVAARALAPAQQNNGDGGRVPLDTVLASFSRKPVTVGKGN